MVGSVLTWAKSVLVHSGVPGQCLITCDPDEAIIPAVVNYIGEDYVAWASDYPHWDAVFPGVLDELGKHMAGLSEQAQQKVLGDNAVRFLNLEGLAPSARASRTGPRA